MGQQRELVAGVEINQRLLGQVFACHVLHPVVVGKNPFNEVFPQHVIVQAALLFHRHQRVGFHQRLGEHTAAIPVHETAFGVVNLDAFHAATGRFRHQDVAAQVGQRG